MIYKVLFTLAFTILIRPGFSQTSLKDWGLKYNKHIGAAVNNLFITLPKDSLYTQILVKEFNAVVPENQFKFRHIHPQPGVFNFSITDSFVDAALKNDLYIRGHVFVWHQALPEWIDTGAFTRTELLSILENHIYTIMARYKGKIHEYDVVNEAIKDDGTLRTSKWRDIIGSDYIDSAFVFAHRADSSALLFYNDYNAEIENIKSDAIFTMVEEMKKNNIPINGVGFQCHFMLDSVNETLMDKNIKRFARLGLYTPLTEADIAVPSNQIGTPKGLASQANDYAKLMRLCLQNNSCNSLMFWGYTDRYSWIPDFWDDSKGAALIFDENYRPKPAYFSLIETLKQNAR